MAEISPAPAKKDIHAMTFQELRAFEQQASHFLIDHKHFKLTQPETWAQLFQRYKQIVIVLDLKCQRTIQDDMTKARQFIPMKERV